MYSDRVTPYFEGHKQTLKTFCDDASTQNGLNVYGERRIVPSKVFVFYLLENYAVNVVKVGFEL